MDDSEKSYGYSEDIYHGRHGRHAEKSYEYGPEGETGDSEGSDLSPEEEAIRVEGPRNEEPVAAQETRNYDYGRDEEAVDSFTWDNRESAPGREARASRTGTPENLPESEEPVGASRGGTAKPAR